MVVGPDELKARASAIAGIDRRDVANVLENEIDRYLVSQGEYQLGFWDGVVITNPAGLVAKRLPYISSVEEIVGEVFNDRLKEKYETIGWKADYHPSEIVHHDNVECSGCHESAKIIFYKQKKE